MKIEEIYKLFLNSNGVSTDTRQITKNSLFFALKGSNFNGNSFAEKSLELGASYAIIDEQHFKVNEKCILVDDVLKTLQLLANFHRKQFKIPVIGITGSNGKTTTKELVYSVLSTTFKTHATKGNLNNHIGIPLTLLAMPQGTEIAIIEMGANHQKEIESYCTYVEPTHGLINNIGKAHLEGFGGIEGVIKGKGELYDYLKQTDGTVFVNSSDETLMKIAPLKNRILFPQPSDYSFTKLVSASPFVTVELASGQTVISHLTGIYNFSNIATAICIGKFFNVTENNIKKAIQDYVPTNNRSQFIQKGTNEILLDAYNANPSSMKVAIENFNLLNKPNKTIIIGDMFELGDESELEHREIGNILAKMNFLNVLFCGKLMHYAYQNLNKGLYFASKTELHNYLKNHPISNGTILIKGSRGMGLESLIDDL